MDNDNHVELGMRILPGVDLALWLRLVVLLILVAAAAGITASAV
jgi:hypothetical protein